MAMSEGARSREIGISATRSLTARLVTGLSGLMIVGGLILALAAFAYGRAAARDAFDRLLVGAANDIAASISIRDGAPVVDLPVSAFELLALAPDDRIAYQVSGPKGAVLTGYEDLPRPGTTAQDSELYDARFKGEPARYIRVTRRFAERQFSGTVEVIVGQTLRARTQLALSITRNALGGLAVGGIAMLAFAIIIVHSALRPLERLAHRISERDPQDLTPIRAAVPREVDVLVQATNGFMGRLDRQFATMKSLISDTAHQLRTPVAALRAQSDLAAEEDDPAQRAQIVAKMHSGTVRLSRLLDQMLSRALVIHRADSARRERVDLRNIALDIFEEGDHAALAPGSEIRLEIAEAEVPVLADELSLSEAAKNLLGNALSHGEAPVTIGADMRDGRARLWVRDAGPGPTPELRARLGERFAPGHSDTRRRGASSGLGLAIAQSVAETYGGTLEMESDAAGFTIAITLPQAEETT
ncbi:sensor histidine kinase [Thioclava sp. DLFJ4-1]|uniref:sensor histidine kinase n=1 Tax=Thioclava sp. DLFJ4-1 TaxID=1915313 RepID=UPI001180356F|nr:sensor histidine kinase [Thioclava sp. DLFJ4-1]